MKKTALVIMAAGMGSRFGKGIKQLEPVGPSGEIIMDYSIHDALEAGFNKIVFITRRELEEDFKKIIGERIEKVAEVEYAFQSLTDLPEGFTCPQGRQKPWGTGHAVLSCAQLVKEPFAVINADDYYGKEAFVKVHDYLVNDHEENGKMQICMAGFILGNTLSEHGAVTRGVCHVDENGSLVGITETSNIIKTPEGAAVDSEDGQKPLDVNNLVSMNMWGLTPAFMKELENGFVNFLSGISRDDCKSEYLLPAVVDQMIKDDRAEVAVLETPDTWFGVTYQEDKYAVKEAFADLLAKGVYQSPLFNLIK